MGDEEASAITVPCPCCGAKLTVDLVLKAVIHHELPPKPAGPAKDLKTAMEALKGEAEKRRGQVPQAAGGKKDKSKVLDKGSREALKKAKEEPVERPTRDIDLD